MFLFALRSMASSVKEIQSVRNRLDHRADAVGDGARDQTTPAVTANRSGWATKS